MRKWLLVLLGVGGAVGAVVSSEFGLTVDFKAVVVGIGAIMVYIFAEGKNDLNRMATQKNKWRDPKFWISAVSAVVASLGASGVNLPVSPEIIVSALTFIVGILFKKGVADTPAV